MRVLVSGASGDIGKAVCLKFLEKGFEVWGLDILPAAITQSGYTHIQADVTGTLPELNDINYIITAAGVQLPDEKTIDVNLKGTIAVIEKYAFQPQIKSVVTIASASGINGAEFPMYSASKGGVIAYTKNLALRLAKFSATANALSPGGVITRSNSPILDDPALYREVLNETLLNKWATADEIADWVYFLAVINRSMTGENILVDNGEMLRSNFVWPK